MEFFNFYFVDISVIHRDRIVHRGICIYVIVIEAHNRIQKTFSIQRIVLGRADIQKRTK